MKKIVWLLIMGLLLFGCVQPSQIMYNPDTAQERRCAFEEGTGALGVGMSQKVIDDCVSDLKRKGYIEIEKVAFTGIFFGGDRSAPLIVEEISPGSPADKAGVKIGDRIIAVDGSKVENYNELRSLPTPSVGETRTYRILRNGQEMEFKITTISRSQMYTGNK